MKEIYTLIHIHASAEHVWNTLMDFDTWPEWNPFITSIERSRQKENSLNVTMQPPGSKRPFNASPVIIRSVENKEFRWLGHIGIKGVFDAEHYFILERLPNGSTSLTHGERFSGILPPFMSGTLKKTEQGFKLMNMALKKRCESHTA
jgi:hypothetical protein